MNARIVHLPSSRCGVDHDTDLEALCYGADENLTLVQCRTCQQSFVQEGDGSLVPVAPAPELDRYNPDDQSALSLDSHWAPLLDGGYGG